MKLPRGVRVRRNSYAAYLTWNGKPVRQVVGLVGCISPKQAGQERAVLQKQIAEGTFVPKRSTPKPVVPASYTVGDLWPVLHPCVP